MTNLNILTASCRKIHWDIKKLKSQKIQNYPRNHSSKFKIAWMGNFLVNDFWMPPPPSIIFLHGYNKLCGRSAILAAALGPESGLI